MCAVEQEKMCSERMGACLCGSTSKGRGNGEGGDVGCSEWRTSGTSHRQVQVLGVHLLLGTVFHFFPKRSWCIKCIFF